MLPLLQGSSQRMRSPGALPDGSSRSCSHSPRNPHRTRLAPLPSSNKHLWSISSCQARMTRYDLEDIVSREWDRHFNRCTVRQSDKWCMRTETHFYGTLDDTLRQMANPAWCWFTRASPTPPTTRWLQVTWDCVSLHLDLWQYSHNAWTQTYFSFKWISVWTEGTESHVHL